MKNKSAFFIFSIAALIIILDQLAKYLISKYMSLHQSIPIIKNVLYLTYIQNTGAGFGILQGWNIILIFVSLVIIGAILFYFDRILKERPLHIPTALILGGAIGNLTDRIFIGYVTDFIDFRIWPAFNVADSCITIGALWIAVYIMFKK